MILIEPYIADLIKDEKIPKIIRYIIVTILCAFVIFIGGILLFKSQMIIGKIFGIILAFIFIIIWLYLIIKIHSNKK